MTLMVSNSMFGIKGKGVLWKAYVIELGFKGANVGTLTLGLNGT
jgi:hypothetical protein